jgi:hypothetical protein
MRKFPLLCQAFMSFVAVVAVLSQATNAQIGAQLGLSAITGSNSSASPNYGPAGNVSKVPLSALLYPSATTKIYVRFMPWFGEKNHTLAGYHSDEPQQIQAQISDMKSRGIAGAFIAWYGQHDEFKDKVTSRFMQQSERDGFLFALSYSGTLDACSKAPGCDVTEAIVTEMNYASRRYMGSPAYVKVNGRPLFFIFDLTKYSIDWNRVRNEVQGQPLILFRNSGGFNHTQSDGAYAWLAPEGSKADDAPSLEYLERFYRAAEQDRNKVVIGSAYKGFDDSQASWGKGRHIPEQCGLTWLSTFAEVNRHYSAKNQLPMLLVVTWNDYEEGTEIETGIDNCVSVSAQAEGTRISWKVSGDPRTIYAFRILGTSDGKSFTALQDVAAAGNHSLDLTDAMPHKGRWTVYVEAIGQPSLLNHLSNPVQITVQ